MTTQDPCIGMIRHVRILHPTLAGFMGLWCLMPLLQYFSYIVAISFIGGGNRRTGENHRPVASH